MYVAVARPEILYATKTVASFVQPPTTSAMAKLKRLVRYLLGFPQGLLRCAKVPGRVRRQRQGRRRSVKFSTTGVGKIFGGHPLEAASATQSLVALSRAEFYRGTAGGLQTCHFLIEAGHEVIARVCVCQGIVHRIGTGRLVTRRSCTCGQERM